MAEKTVAVSPIPSTLRRRLQRRRRTDEDRSFKLQFGMVTVTTAADSTARAHYHDHNNHNDYARTLTSHHLVDKQQFQTAQHTALSGKFDAQAMAPTGGKVRLVPI